MKLPTYKIALYLAVIYCLVMVTIAPSCNESNLRKGIDASYRLPAATNDLTNKIRAGRDAGIVPAGEAAAFGALLNQAAKAEQIFVGMVKAVHAMVERGEKVPEQKFSELRNFFDLEIVEPFLQVFQKAGILSGQDATLIIAGITAARLLLRTIARGIGSKKTIPATPAISGLGYLKLWSALEWRQYN